MTWITRTRKSPIRTAVPPGPPGQPRPATAGEHAYAQPSANGDSTHAAETSDERSPEEARSTITAIERGWERGRSLFDPPEKTTETMTGTQPAGGQPSPPEAGEAGVQGDE